MVDAETEFVAVAPSKLPQQQCSDKRPWRSPRVILPRLLRDTAKSSNTTNEAHKSTDTVIFSS